MFKRHSLIFGFFAFTLTACDGSSSPQMNVVSRCNFIPLSGGCWDFGANYETSSESAEAECVEMEGEFSTSACPTEDRVGSCFSKVNELVIRFYSSTGEDPAWTTEQAQDYCRQGTFVAN